MEKPKAQILSHKFQISNLKLQISNLNFLLIFFAVMLLSSCSGDSYEIRGDKVYYTWWGFSFGHQEQELIGADAATFEQVNDWLGKDKSHVYYEARLVEGCDPQTLKVVKKGLICDAKDYYYKGAAIHVADIESFEVLKLDEYNLWAKDSKCGYFDSTRIDSIDPGSFEVVGTFLAKDKNRVYYRYRVLPQADPATFEELEGCYMRDNIHAWYIDSLIPDAEGKTLQSKWNYAWDSKRVWYNGRLLKGADPKTFEVLESGYYAKDAKTVWYHDEVVKGADAPSFKDDGEMIGHDKNQRYVCERLYDLDE